MESLPEEPLTINEQLRQLPAYRALLAPPPEPEAARPLTASRVLAALMQLKDTAAILLLLSDGSLLFGIICLFGIPGLVLYGLRWRQVRGRAGCGAVVVQAVLSLLHELFWTYAFHDATASTDGPPHPEVLTVLYGLGALLSLGQLLVATSGATDGSDYPASLSTGQPAE
ncbi:MAG: hypothetical protein ACRYF0_08040 [Janthinobacterium lividum]